LEIVESPTPSPDCQLQIDVGNDADEELSLSPSGVNQNCDLAPINTMDVAIEPATEDNDNDIFFVCATPSTPRSQLGIIKSSPSPPLSPPWEPTNCNSVQQETMRQKITVSNENGSKASHITHLKVHTYTNEINNGSQSSGGDEDTKKVTTDHGSVPLFKFSNGISLAHSDSDGSHNEHETGFDDCNIHLSLRSRAIKPATAFINKLSTNLNNNNNNNMNDYTKSPPPSQGVYSSSEDDSVWYEYGCV